MSTTGHVDATQKHGLLDAMPESSPPLKTAIVLGSTGLIGSELVRLLEASPRYGSVLLLNRRPSGHVHPKVSERIIDFDAPDLSGIAGDDLYCVFGTTLRKAGSQSALRKIDCDYPTTIATRLRKQGVTRLLLVSSVGASATARSFYLRTKAQLEANMIALGFEHLVIARPSFLTGRKGEFRLGEEAAILILRLLSPLMLGGLRKYRGIDASQVAQSLVQAAIAGAAGVQILDYDTIRSPR